MRPLPDQAFEFGEHILIPKERLLLCAGEPVLLTGKVFDLLVALVRRSGHLLTKDELFEEVWPNTVVQETNLTVNMSALRKALQRGSDRNVIQTVPGRGYRFVAPVVTHQDFTLASEAPFSKRQTRPPGRRQTENADAYRAYLQGRHEWGQRSEVALKRAIELFSQAIMFDPRFAAAHSGLADCHSILGYLSYLSPAESFPRAREHAVRAIGLDASLAEAHSSLGFVKFYFEWDWVAAESEFRHAIALDPLQAAPHHWYSIYLPAAGRAAEALGEIQFAQAREPLSLLVNTDLGFHFYYTGQYDEAVKQLKLVLKMSPDFPPAHLWLGR